MLYIPELYIGSLLCNLHKKNIFYSKKLLRQALIQTTTKILKVLKKTWRFQKEHAKNMKQTKSSKKHDIYEKHTEWLKGVIHKKKWKVCL